MASSSAACVFGGAVDFVRQDHVGKDRAAHERHSSTVGSFLQDLDAGDVGRHQVRRELNALELQMEYLGDGFDEQRFRQARRSGDQTMSSREEGNQDLFDDVLLPDDHLFKFRLDARAARGELLDELLFGSLHASESLRRK
jgi:hypothetical protein